MSLGSALQQARLAAGLSIAEISDATRIRQNVITDLENDNFSSCGGVAYARGHIRTIAKMVHADADALIVELETTTGELDRPMIDLLTENFATPPQIEKSGFSYKTLSMVAAGVLALLVLVPTVNGFMHTNTAKKVATVALAAPSASNTPVPVNTPSDNPVVATKTSAVTVVVDATAGSTWLGVTDSSGAQVFAGKLSKGQTQSFENNQPLNFVIGNAGAVNLTVNGQNAGAPGAIGEVVHLQFGPGSSAQG